MSMKRQTYPSSLPANSTVLLEAELTECALPSSDERMLERIGQQLVHDEPHGMARSMLIVTRSLCITRHARPVIRP
jgi:hypothetical protein